MAKSIIGPIEAPSKRAAIINRPTRFCCLPRKKRKCKNHKHELIHINDDNNNNNNNDSEKDES
jgi:hypothetical protein